MRPQFAIASIIQLILISIFVLCGLGSQGQQRKNQFVAEVGTDCELGKVEQMEERLKSYKEIWQTEFRSTVR